MDKSRFIIAEDFQSSTQQQRKENLQNAVDQYLRLILKNGGMPTGNRFDDQAEQKPRGSRVSREV